MQADAGQADLLEDADQAVRAAIAGRADGGGAVDGVLVGRAAGHRAAETARD